MILNPQNDIGVINKFALDKEAANTSHVLYCYDKQWNNVIIKLNKIDAQILNLEDELKNLKNTLSFDVKINYKKYKFDKSLSDKSAEGWATMQDDYVSKFAQLKLKRTERAELLSEEHLYKNMHYQILDRSKRIETLVFLWSGQYFNTQNGEKTKTKEMEETSIINEMTNHLNKKRKKNV